MIICMIRSCLSGSRNIRAGERDVDTSACARRRYFYRLGVVRLRVMRLVRIDEKSPETAEETQYFTAPNTIVVSLEFFRRHMVLFFSRSASTQARKIVRFHYNARFRAYEATKINPIENLKKFECKT